MSAAAAAGGGGGSAGGGGGSGGGAAGSASQRRNAAAGAGAPSSSPAAEAGATWCRRAARAVSQRLADGAQLFREYQYVVALDDAIRHAQADAVRAEAAGRNRYANVLPYDYNR